MQLDLMTTHNNWLNYIVIIKLLYDFLQTITYCTSNIDNNIILKLE